MHDAMMQLNGDERKKFLVGGYDERDDAQYSIHLRVNYYKSESISNLQLFENHSLGTLQGEASSFFLVAAKQTDQTWCELVDLKMIHRPDSADSLFQDLKSFLQHNGYSLSDIDVLINGVSGALNNDVILNNLVQSHLSDIPELRYKHLSGEYCTASSFGLWLGASVLKKQHIPDAVKVGTVAHNGAVKSVLLISQYMGRNYSFVLLKKVN
jgi:hypothetical protein